MQTASRAKKKSEGREIPPLAESEYYESSTQDERKSLVGFHPSFSRHGITRASSVLLIWLNENVD